MNYKYRLHAICQVALIYVNLQILLIPLELAERSGRSRLPRFQGIYKIPQTPTGFLRSLELCCLIFCIFIGASDRAITLL
jgi:hypothetical protein